MNRTLEWASPYPILVRSSFLFSHQYKIVYGESNELGDYERIRIMERLGPNGEPKDRFNLSKLLGQLRSWNALCRI